MCTYCCVHISYVVHKYVGGTRSCSSKPQGGAGAAVQVAHLHEGVKVGLSDKVG
jgi:hypothetical protein